MSIDAFAQHRRRQKTERPVIRVHGLNHYFGSGEARSQVLFDNRLEVMPGEIVIMTGPSGSGKTTLLTLIGGLRTVQEGSVEVLGEQLYGLNNRQLVEIRRRIGFIFQAHNLFESLTALQTVRMALELGSLDRTENTRRAMEMLEAVGLGHRIHYKPAALSGGQKQRVAIARALANKPKLILADEPTAALDEKSGREVVALLQKLAREEKCTSIIVTHDNRILDVADRIVNMVGGRIHSDVVVAESVIICEFLSKCEIFAHFTPDMLSYVADKMSREEFSPGDIIVRQGDEGDKFYLIAEGTVEVAIRDDKGEHLVRTLSVGEFFGERALMTGEKRSATVRARTEVTTYTLGKEDFNAALGAVPSFREQLLKVFFQRQ
ncbi:MAG: ABC transporter ATP-binding protein [Gemmatales bacterium]|nr:MAG: ABC transporter ATP-binding protein [Gemmatales bacterium]